MYLSSIYPSICLRSIYSCEKGYVWRQLRSSVEKISFCVLFVFSLFSSSWERQKDENYGRQKDESTVDITFIKIARREAEQEKEEKDERKKENKEREEEATTRV